MFERWSQVMSPKTKWTTACFLPAHLPRMDPGDTSIYHQIKEIEPYNRYLIELACSACIGEFESWSLLFVCLWVCFVLFVFVFFFLVYDLKRTRSIFLQYGPHATSTTKPCTCMSCGTTLTDPSYQEWWQSLWGWVLDFVVQGLHFSVRCSPARYRSRGHLLKQRPYPCLETTEARTEKPEHRFTDKVNTIKPKRAGVHKLCPKNHQQTICITLSLCFKTIPRVKPLMKISLICKRMN